MVCPECGQELDSNNTCQNPNCITKVKKEYEDEQLKQSYEDEQTKQSYGDEQTKQNIDSNINSSHYNNNNSNNYNSQSQENQNIEFRDENGISPVEMLEFLGYKNTEYYMEKWTRFQDNAKFISWNWPAFLFGPFWCWFRKMYNLAGILLAINLSSLILLFHFGWLRSIVSLTLTIGSGLLANQLYINHATKKIKSAKFTTSAEFDNSMLLRRLNSIGGITWVPLFVAVILWVVIIIISIIGFIALRTASGSFIF